MGPIPISIKVVSILGIILAGITLLLLPCGLYLTFHPLMPNPAMDALVHDPSYLAFLEVATVVRLVLAILLLTASIMSLKLKPLGRTLMIAYACSLIVFALLSTLFSFILIVPKMAQAFAADPHTPPEVANAAKIGGVIGGLIGCFVYLAIAGVILYFFNRSVARNAFKGIFPAQPNDLPIEFPPGSPPV